MARDRRTEFPAELNRDRQKARNLPLNGITRAHLARDVEESLVDRDRLDDIEDSIKGIRRELRIDFDRIAETREEIRRSVMETSNDLLELYKKLREEPDYEGQFSAIKKTDEKIQFIVGNLSGNASDPQQFSSIKQTADQIRTTVTRLNTGPENEDFDQMQFSSIKQTYDEIKMTVSNLQLTDWREGEEYEEGDRVFLYGEDETVYEALVDHTSSSNNKPPNSDYWEDTEEGWSDVQFSSIRQTYDEIDLQVREDEIVTQLNLNPEGIAMIADQVALRTANNNVVFDGTGIWMGYGENPSENIRFLVDSSGEEFFVGDLEDNYMRWLNGVLTIVGDGVFKGSVEIEDSEGNHLTKIEGGLIQTTGIWSRELYYQNGSLTIVPRMEIVEGNDILDPTEMYLYELPTSEPVEDDRIWKDSGVLRIGDDIGGSITSKDETVTLAEGDSYGNYNKGIIIDMAVEKIGDAGQLEVHYDGDTHYLYADGDSWSDEQFWITEEFYIYAVYDDTEFTFKMNGVL